MDDESIIRGLKRGDAEAAEQMMDVYGNRLLRAAWLLCRNETEAQDLVQQTLLEAVRSAARCRASSLLFTWLYGILLNLFRCYCRRQRLISYTDNVPETPDDEAGQDDGLDKDMAGNIWQALDKLSVEQREVIVLRYYEGMNIREIAGCTGLSTGTVKSRLFYAICRLRKRFLKIN